MDAKATKEAAKRAKEAEKLRQKEDEKKKSEDEKARKQAEKEEAAKIKASKSKKTTVCFIALNRTEEDLLCFAMLECLSQRVLE